MSLRFFNYLAVAVIAGFLVVVTNGSAADGGLSALVFALSIGLVALAILRVVSIGRKPLAAALPALIGVLSVWTLIASIFFSNDTIRTLGFADGLGILALAVGGLILHEISTERVVHELDVSASAPDAAAAA